MRAAASAPLARLPRALPSVSKAGASRARLRRRAPGVISKPGIAPFTNAARPRTRERGPPDVAERNPCRVDLRHCAVAELADNRVGGVDESGGRTRSGAAAPPASPPSRRSDAPGTTENTSGCSRAGRAPLAPGSSMVISTVGHPRGGEGTRMAVAACGARGSLADNRESPVLLHTGSVWMRRRPRRTRRRAWQWRARKPAAAPRTARRSSPR